MDFRIASTERLAHRWGVSSKTIRTWNWLLPAKVGRGRYDEVRAHTLFIEHRVMPMFSTPDDGESLDTARRRKEVAVANLKELQEQQVRGSLVPKDQAEDWLVQIITEAKTVLLAIPRRLAVVLSGESDPRGVEDKLRAEIHAALNKLAKGGK